MAKDNEPVLADRAGFAFCCGIDIVGNFCGGYRKIDLRQPLKDQLGEIHGILMATTVEWQEEAIEELKTYGFTPILEFWNDVHADPKRAPQGNLVTLWMKDRGDGNTKRL